MHCKSYSHFFSKKFQHICVSLDVNLTNRLLTTLLAFNNWAQVFGHSCKAHVSLVCWAKKYSSCCFFSPRKHVNPLCTEFSSGLGLWRCLVSRAPIILIVFRQIYPGSHTCISVNTLLYVWTCLDHVTAICH